MLTYTSGGFSVLTFIIRQMNLLLGPLLLPLQQPSPPSEAGAHRPLLVQLQQVQRGLGSELLITECLCCSEAVEEDRQQRSSRPQPYRFLGLDDHLSLFEDHLSHVDTTHLDHQLTGLVLLE